MTGECSNQSGIVVAIKANYLLVDVKDKNLNFIRLLCTCRTKLRFEGTSIFAGDLVLVEEIDWKNSTGVVYKLKPRKSLLFRPQVANCTDIFVTISVKEPDFNAEQVSRFLIAAENTEQNVTIILTKIDLINKKQSNQYFDRLNGWGYSPLLVSIKTKEGISELLEKIKESQLSVFSGPSGVGKSSLLKYFLPNSSIQVGKLSKKLNKGKHTTRHVQLFSLKKDSFLADTPGFNRPEVNFDVKRFSYLFPELRIQLMNNMKCRFRNCFHIDEPGCAIDKNWERYSFYKAYISNNINRYS